MDILKAWETLADETLYETGRLRLARETVRLQDGRVIKDYYQIHMGVAAVIAATRTDGTLILVRMYKHGARRHGIGFPGGGVEPGEEPLAAARRELREETGYGEGTWRKLGDYAVHSNQGCGHVHFFMAENVARVGEPMTEHDLEPHEFVFLDRPAVRRAVAGQDFLSLGHVCMATLWLNAAGEPR
jgi:ADP-ribose pyrophosphatase